MLVPFAGKYQVSCAGGSVRAYVNDADTYEAILMAMLQAKFRGFSREHRVLKAVLRRVDDINDTTFTIEMLAEFIEKAVGFMPTRVAPIKRTGANSLYIVVWT